MFDEELDELIRLLRSLTQSSQSVVTVISKLERDQERIHQKIDFLVGQSRDLERSIELLRSQISIELNDLKLDINEIRKQRQIN